MVTKDSTLGIIEIDGVPQCFTLEDGYRKVKEAGKTRIPPGKYEVKVRNHGGFNTRYARIFPSFHRGMLELSGVKGFTDILIHCGNTVGDTSGLHSGRPVWYTTRRRGRL